MKFILFFLKGILFFVLYSLIEKVLFLSGLGEKIDVLAIINTTLYGWQYDFGIYTIFLCILFLGIQLLPVAWARRFSFSLTLLFIISIIVFKAIDMFLIRSWGAIFNIRVWTYLHNTNHIYNNFLSPLIVLSAMLLVFASLCVSIFFQRFVLYSETIQIKKIGKIDFLFLLLMLIVAGLSMRGWLREIPLNHSDANHSKNRNYNFASINSLWNLGNVYWENRKYLDQNPYQYFDPEYASVLVDSLIVQGTDDTIQLLGSKNLERPNIILIVMEGINAELLNNPQHMPFLRRLRDSSYSMNCAYSVGFRTEQGLTALYSGLFASPHKNLTDNINNIKDIPTIFQSAQETGYMTSFYFGGDLEFANMKSYIKSNKVEKVLDKNDFSFAQRTQKLGVNDSIFFRRVLSELKTLKSPYFASVLTQSTHEPYDIPENQYLLSEEKKYIQASHFLDRQLNRFFHALEQNQMDTNTLIIVTSDHASQHPENYDIGDMRRYHIPFIFYSKKMKREYVGYRDSLIFRQNNFPATLSYLVKWKKKNYTPYSTNHFSSSRKFSFSTFVDGYKFIDSNNELYDIEYIWARIPRNDSQRIYKNRFPLALMQHIVDEIRGTSPIKKIK